MSAPNFFVVFEGKNLRIFSSQREASENDNIEGQHFRTFATFCEAMAVHSIYKEPKQVQLLQASLYGAPTQEKRDKLDGRVMDHTEQAIEDAMTIGKQVADSPVTDDEEVDDDDESADGGQPPSNGQSSNSNA